MRATVPPTPGATSTSAGGLTLIGPRGEGYSPSVEVTIGFTLLAMPAMGAAIWLTQNVIAPQQTPEALNYWALASGLAVVVATAAIPQVWFSVRYKEFRDAEIRSLALGLAEDRLLRRRDGWRRVRTLHRLDRKVRNTDKALADLAEARGALAASTAPEPRLLEEIDERAALLRRQREEIREQARAYTAQERRMVYGGPDTVRRRQDDAALGQVMQALSAARKTTQP